MYLFSGMFFAIVDEKLAH